MVLNPTKVDDVAMFKKTVRATLAEHGWAEPVWMETTLSDPGCGQAIEAAQAGVDLVIAAGGDGTVTACAAGLAGRRVPLAILPTGTGNLLALNLGIPADLGQAIEAFVTGIDRPVDLGIANGRSFVAMAGLGLDANMLQGTTEAAKKRFGYAAYVVSVFRHMRDKPLRITVRADDGAPSRHRATGIVVGNVGWLHRGLRLLPDARPDDGLLDVVVLTTHGLTSSIMLALDILLRRQDTRIFRRTFRTLRIVADREQLWEVDGEVAGRTQELEVSVHAEKLLLRVPGGSPEGADDAAR